jgi:ATP-dependent Clp protease ATP-binding subunit ClpA
MDHGTLTDNNGRKADFRNVIIIMTTNAGAETMQKSTIGFTNAREAGDEMADIKRMFTPEFRNRLDAVVSFRALNEEIILRVVDKFLLQLEGQLAEKKVEVTFTDGLRKHLAKTGFDPLMGARPMQRLIQDTVRRALADELLFGRLVDGGRLTVDVDDKGDNYTVRMSSSYGFWWLNPLYLGDLLFERNVREFSPALIESFYLFHKIQLATLMGMALQILRCI